MSETTTTFATSGMHCRSCSMLIDMTLGELEGVASAKTDLATGQTVVAYDSDQLDTERIIRAIRGAGYDAEVL